jgi:hypothetical protein
MSDGPLSDRIVCLSAVSKDLEGELRLLESEKEECRERDCTTLETLHQIELKAARHDCDSDAGSVLDGVLHSGDLVHKFEGGDGNNRGIHEGSFRWKGAGALATGTLRGVTNMGTHRPPAFKECQRCDERGVMEGLLLGTIRRARDPRLIGCGIQAAYRLRFDPSSDGGSGAVAGTLEGELVCDCGGPPKVCIELSSLAPGPLPAPLPVSGISFAVQNSSGASVPPEVRTMGTFTGLDVSFRTEVTIPLSSAVEATLVTFAQAAEMEAFNTDGTSAGVAAMTGTQNVAETLRVTGTSIDRAVITAKADETLLLRFCFEPLPR